MYVVYTAWVLYVYTVYILPGSYMYIYTVYRLPGSYMPGFIGAPPPWFHLTHISRDIVPLIIVIQYLHRDDVVKLPYYHSRHHRVHLHHLLYYSIIDIIDY